MLMTPTSASRCSVMKSFIKRNTPLRVDPKVREPVPRAELCQRRCLASGSWLAPRLLAGPEAAGSRASAPRQV